MRCADTALFLVTRLHVLVVIDQVGQALLVAHPAQRLARHLQAVWRFRAQEAEWSTACVGREQRRGRREPCSSPGNYIVARAVTSTAAMSQRMLHSACRCAACLLIPIYCGRLPAVAWEGGQACHAIHAHAGCMAGAGWCSLRGMRRRPGIAQDQASACSECAAHTCRQARQVAALVAKGVEAVRPALPPALLGGGDAR